MGAVKISKNSQAMFTFPQFLAKTAPKYTVPEFNLIASVLLLPKVWKIMRPETWETLFDSFKDWVWSGAYQLTVWYCTLHHITMEKNKEMKSPVGQNRNLGHPKYL